MQQNQQQQYNQQQYNQQYQQQYQQYYQQNQQIQNKLQQQYQSQQPSLMTSTCNSVTTTITTTVTHENTITVTIPEPTTKTPNVSQETKTSINSSTNTFSILDSSLCKNLLNKYFKLNINVYFEDGINLLTSSEGFIINQGMIKDCSENYSSINTDVNEKHMTYDPQKGLCIGQKCYHIERVIDFSCQFNNNNEVIFNKEYDEFPTDKTKWFSIQNGKEITTFYDGNTLICSGESCPLSFECTSTSNKELEDVTFNYFDHKLMIKPSNNDNIEIFSNNSQLNAILTIFSKLNIIVNIDKYIIIKFHKIIEIT